MRYDIRFLSSYPPRECGIGKFTANLATALEPLSETGKISVAAISNAKAPYTIPVDIVIDQYNQQSWRSANLDILRRADESGFPTVMIPQHEYGLDGMDALGDNYVQMAREFSRRGHLTITYLHTVLRNPNDHQKQVAQELAQCSDGLVVTTESAINVLRESYGISPSKIKHIDHGVRIRDVTATDREKVKDKYGLKNKLLVTTLGMLSPDKGLHYSIPAYALFVENSLEGEQRDKVRYLIAGRFHRDFVGTEDGGPYREYVKMLNQIITDSGLRYSEVHAMSDADFENNDIIFLNDFLEEELLMEIYGATNVMVLPYLNMEQISSGILADTIGSGRIPITTKFMYARELVGLDEYRECTIICPRGVLVDPGEPSIRQIAEGLDTVLFNEPERLEMEFSARARGYTMKWDTSAQELVYYIRFLTEERAIETGRGPKLTRQRESTLRIK